MEIPNFLKKIICFIFRKRISELKAKQIADSYTIKTVTSGSHGPGKQSTLQSIKELGIKKVELICPHNCECCKNLFNKKLSIDEVPQLPREECQLERCFGRYCAVVEFNLS